MKDLEKKTKKQFGGNENPLLGSVRSGSSMSMPGMCWLTGQSSVTEIPGRF
jgi:phosphoenolpyruvate synthase/pyruvate phosphate dikinase